MTQLSIPSRYNGPPTSGNGGYSCGVVANFVDGPARVRLHKPPPLDTPLAVHLTGDGSVEVFHENDLVASGFPAPLAMDIPAAPSLEEARRGSKRYPCAEHHMFPTCFVCGTGRSHGDDLELYPGPVDGWELLACPWTPAADLADVDGSVRLEVVWAALDCPGCYAALGGEMKPVLLGKFWPVPTPPGLC